MSDDDVNVPIITPEEQFRKAQTPLDHFLVVLALLGEGKATKEIVSAAVDAKIESSRFPEGVNREMVKKGILGMLVNGKKIWSSP